MPFRQVSEEALLARIAELEAELVPLREEAGKGESARAQHEDRARRLAALRERAATLQAEVLRAERRSSGNASLVFSGGSDTDHKDARPSAGKLGGSLARLGRGNDVFGVITCGGLLAFSMLLLGMPAWVAGLVGAFPTTLAVLTIFGWRGDGL